MNKVYGLIMMGFSLLLMLGCEEDIPVFGDKSIPSELELVSVTDSVGGYDYGFINPVPTDTTYVRFYTTRDSVFLEDGTYDKIKIDTVYYDGQTAKLYTVPTILLPKYKNRLYIQLKSNARWTAPTIPFSSTLATWIKNSKVSGIGDGIIEYNINPRSTNPNSTISTRRKIQNQYITTRDSMVMYKLSFSQKSMIED